MDDFKWKFRWCNTAWLYSCFCPAYYARRDIVRKSANDNGAANSQG